MSRYGSITVSAPSALRVRTVESAEADNLEALVTAALAALPGGFTVIGLTLAGAGDGHTFTVTLEAGLNADVTGGFSSLPSVRCVLASTADELERLLSLLDLTGLAVADIQVVGSSKGLRFMALVVIGALADGGGASAIVQMGFDQVIKTMTFTPVNQRTLVPRDGNGNPVRVILPNVTPGNVLEVTWNGTVGLSSGDNPNALFEAYVVVSFDGSDAYPTNFFIVNNTNSGGEVPNGEFGDGGLDFGAFAAVTIPDGATTATVEMAYLLIGDPVNITGTDLGGDEALGLTLKATELLASSVSQLGPSTLEPAS